MDGRTFRYGKDGERVWLADVAITIEARISQLDGSEEPGRDPQVTHLMLVVVAKDNPVPFRFPIELKELKSLDFLEANGIFEQRDRTQTGTGQIINAAFAASRDAARRLAPTRTGWHVREDGSRVYIAANTIVGSGNDDGRYVSDRVSPVASHVTLERDRDVDWETDLPYFLSMLDLAPDSLTVFLLGAALRGVIKEARYTIYVQGETNTGKSGLVSCILQSVATGTSRNDLGGRTFRSTGTSVAGLLQVLRHTPVFIDDQTQEKDQEDQRQSAKNAVRAMHDNAPRGRARRDGTLAPVVPIEAGGLILAGEYAIFEDGTSAENRQITLVVPGAGSIRTTEKDYGELSLESFGRPENIARRNAVTVAFIDHLAMLSAAEFREEFAERHATAKGMLLDRLTDETAHSRFTDMATEPLLGLLWFVDFLLDTDRIPSADAQRLTLRFLAAVANVARRQFDPEEQHALGESIVDAFRSVLVEGSGHLVSAATGQHPSSADGLSVEESAASLRAFGWRQEGRTSMGLPEFRAKGRTLGEVARDGRLHLDPSIFLQSVKDHLSSSQRLLADATLLDALERRGAITVDVRYEKSKAKRYKVVRRDGSGRQVRVLDACPRNLLGVSIEGAGGRGVVRASVEDTAVTPTIEGKPFEEYEQLPSDVLIDPDVDADVDTNDAAESTDPADTTAQEIDNASSQVSGLDPAFVEALPELPGRLASSYAVIDVSGCYYPNGERFADFPSAHHVGQVAELATNHRLSTPERSGILWLTAAAAAALGLESEEDVYEKHAHPFVSEAVADGFQVWHTGKDDGQRSVLRSTMGVSKKGTDEQRGMRQVWVYVPSIAKSGLGVGSSLRELLATLAHLAFELDTPYTVVPNVGRTILGNIYRTKRTGKDPNGDPYTIAPRAQEVKYPNTIPDPTTFFLRQPTEAESQRAYVHGYDVNGAFHNSAANLKLAYGTLGHVTSPDFDKKTVGIWKTEIPHGLLSDSRLPDVFAAIAAPGRSRGEQFWPTELLALLSVYGVEVPPISEAYLWDGSYKALGGKNSWTEKLWSARQSLEVKAEAGELGAREAAKIVKLIVNSYVGWMNSETGEHPEWRHQIIAHTTRLVAEKVWLVGRDSDEFPVAQFSDAVYYLSDVEDPTEHARLIGLPVEDRIGKFKVAGTARVDAVRSAFLAGDGKPWMHPTIKHLRILKDGVEGGVL